jgi:quercetin 2,3-dioxygenase
MKTRKIKTFFKSKSVIEGAGVYLKRAIGFDEVPQFDPFLLFDDFRSDKKEEYIKGFPWHPHRGIETITYVIDGVVEHKDSLGNGGIISSGDVQWMTAGSGIIHQEMPKGNKNNAMYGFQLWLNLPASYKMMDPGYQEIKGNDIPVITLENDIKIKIICGSYNNKKGPVDDIIADPEYLDVFIPSNSKYILLTKKGYTVFLYVIEGQSYFCKEKNTFSNGTLVHFDDGDQIIVETKNKPVRFLFFSGKPLKEPVAWYGPIVMNTQKELETAFFEYQNNTFIKKK